MITKINEISITPIKPTSGLVGFASFVLDHTFYIGSVGIYTRPLGGYRLIYPTKKLGEKNIPLAYPIDKTVGREIEEMVIKKFEEVMKYDRHSSVSF